MLLPFEQLSRHNFALSDIHVICQRPAYRRLNIKKRTCNGFIYVIAGHCRYTFAGGAFTLGPGSLAYLPLGSQHVMEITGGKFEFFRVNFTMHIDREQVLFSETPLKLTDRILPDGDSAIRALEALGRVERNTVQETAYLCQTLASLQQNLAKPYSEKVAPAVRYLQQNASQTVDCGYLAQLCLVSTTRLYQLFHRELGMTPLQYRDKLLLDRALPLLKAGDITVNEIAEMLGFSDPAYFSRFIKKHTGCTPKQYTQEGLCKTQY